ncbi:unnamed protein product [Nezara viridula]|uniref:Uncharacterized protein n=1 Tax=Nezara viridula TaxID=85310 RepID=A0A9P0H834_NEZVI|nr:unnamed protein product [Nezara viridula]
MVSAFPALVFLGTYIFHQDEIPENERSKLTDNSTLSVKWCCNSSIFDPLATASIRGYPEEVERILKEDPKNIDIQEEGGLTSLHWASIRGHVDVVKKLLEYGANVSSTDEDNNTALHMAALSGNLEVVHILLVSGSPINAQNMFGDTPLHLAVKQGHFDSVETLLSHGASTNIFNYKKKTPLGLAVTKRNEPLVRLLRTASEHSEAHYWVNMNEEIPTDAVLGGNDPHNCNRSFIGRIMISGQFVPAKVCPNLRRAYAVVNGSEFSSNQYQVLTSSHAAWRRMTDEDDIPYEAIVGGTTSTGEKIYIGRSFISFEEVLYLVPGKVRSSNRRLSMPLFGSVYDKTNYEILVSYY